MRSLILSQWRDLRIGVTREDLGALTHCAAVVPRHSVVCLSVCLPAYVSVSVSLCVKSSISISSSAEYNDLITR